MNWVNWKSEDRTDQKFDEWKWGVSKTNDWT
jgi:hypothetical protein